MPFPLPTPDPPLPLPLPPSVLKALLLGTFTLHLLAVNLGVGGAVLAATHALRGRPEDRELVGRVAPLLPAAVTFTINLGVAPLLFVQLLYGDFFYTASVLTAFPWLALVALLMAGYLLLYRFVGAVTAPVPRAGAGLLGALLLLAVGLLLVNVTTLSLRPDLWLAQAAASPRGLRLNTLDPTLWPRFLHQAAGILASAGLFLAGWGAWRDHGYARRVGLRWFLGATASQLLWGTWLLVRQPGPLLDVLLGGTAPASLALWCSVACGALGLFMAIPASERDAPARAAWAPLGLGAAAVLGMSLLREQLREASLAAAGFRAGDLPHRTDWPALGLFSVAFLGVAALLLLLRRWASQLVGGPGQGAP